MRGNTPLYALGILLLGTMIPVGGLAILGFRFLLAFGHDPRCQTLAEYLLVMAQPFLAIGGIIIVSVLLAQVFESGRVATALSLASVLFVLAWYAVFVVWNYEPTIWDFISLI